MSDGPLPRKPGEKQMPPRIIDPNVIGTQGAAGIVEGLETGEYMASLYTDEDGDQITNDGSIIEGRGGDDSIYAGWGDDTIDGGDGVDILFAGRGDDEVSGGEGDDSIWGDEGQDSLYGNFGDDKIVGGAGDDLLIGGAGNDSLIGDQNPGDAGGLDPSDPPEPGYGNDTLITDSGDDTAYGGAGDDLFEISDDFGNHLIIGGETGETAQGDSLDGSLVENDVRVIFRGDEAGTITDGASTINFAEIEKTYLGSGDDQVDVISSTTGYVNGGDGFDTLVLPDPAPGDPAPAVTITGSVDNGDTTTTYAGYVNFPDGSRMDFENFEEIICFTPGTMIDTSRGKVAVEELTPGDNVLTRDHGYQTLAWVGRRDLTAAEMARCAAAAPIRIEAGALGANLPERDLRVSPRHRMLITGARAELMFGEREVLVTAADLLGLPGVSQEAPDAVSYIHVMCDAHQIIRAEGSWTESFQPAEAVLNAMDAESRAELLGMFPDLGKDGFASARPVLNGAEAKVLFAA